MTLLSYFYRFLSNFAFLAVVYLTLNYLSKYDERATIAILILAYSAMRTISTIRLFVFFQKIERLETETKSAASSGPNQGSMRKTIIREVATLRHQGELKAYIDLLFLTLTALLCLSKIFG